MPSTCVPTSRPLLPAIEHIPASSTHNESQRPLGIAKHGTVHNCATTANASDTGLLLRAQILANQNNGQTPLLSDVNCARVRRLEIADNGIGFDPQYSEKFFARFQRLHRRGKYEGSGIGLAIVRKSIDRHNGEMIVNSEPGRARCSLCCLRKNKTQRKTGNDTEKTSISSADGGR